MTAQDRALSLLKVAEEKLAALNSLTAEISGRRTLNDPDPKKRSHAAFTGNIQLLRPNQAYVRYQSGKRHVIAVADGADLWQWERGEKEYHKRPIDSKGQKIGVQDGLPVGWPVEAFFQARFPHIEAAPTLTREGRYEVVEFVDAPQVRQRFYIGPDGLVNRFVNEQLGGRYVGEWILKNLRPNASLRPTQFAFTPQPGTTLYVPPPPPELLKIGTLAPDFTLPDEKGQPVQLSALRGKVVVLDFWGASCGPCLEAFPHNDAVAKKLGAEVAFLAVHVQDTKENFLRWRQKNPGYPSLRFVVDPAPLGQEVGTRLYKIFAQPTVYVIGKDGRIAKSFVGYVGPTPALENAIIAALA